MLSENCEMWKKRELELYPGCSGLLPRCNRHIHREEDSRAKGLMVMNLEELSEQSDKSPISHTPEMGAFLRNTQHSNRQMLVDELVLKTIGRIERE